MGTRVKLTYAAPLELFKHEKPFYSILPFTISGAKQTNFASSVEEFEIRDIRKRIGDFSLEQNGFQIVDHATTFDDWHGGTKVVKEHYPEVHELLMHTLGADRVFIFDHSVRYSICQFTPSTDHGASKDSERYCW